jgi:hypothetical protein
VKSRQTFAIRFSRLPRVADAPGLIALSVDTSNGTQAPKRIGALTDVALRGRLAHFDAHSANEVAAIRQALGPDRGEVTVYENWSNLGSCLQFWHGFVGSRIRSVDWTCAACAAPDRAEVGASVGESFLRRCRCGKVNRVTVTALIPAIPR